MNDITNTSEFYLTYYTNDDGIWVIHNPCDEKHLLPWGEQGLDKAIEWAAQHSCGSKVKGD